MRSTIKLPDKINVGFQERDSTYTGKLAYIIYFDEKGKLRKENSWNGWRDTKIPNEIYENKPTEGFVLNKKVGGYATGWNHRNTYVRVYDPRGFEFEINVPNLLYILENTSSIIGKGLEGEFVYGWDGKDLVLIPCNSSDYKEISEFNNKVKISKRYKGKDMKLGATYRDKENRELVYVGRYFEYNNDNKETRKYFFYNIKAERFTTISNLGDNIIETISEEPVKNYAFIMDSLKKYSYYSPRDPKKDQYVDYTLKELIELDKGYTKTFFSDISGEFKKYIFQKERNYWNSYYHSRGRKNGVKEREVYEYHKNFYYGNYDERLCYITLENILNKFKPKYLVTYDTKGNLIKKHTNLKGDD